MRAITYYPYTAINCSYPMTWQGARYVLHAIPQAVAESSQGPFQRLRNPIGKRPQQFDWGLSEAYTA